MLDLITRCLLGILLISIPRAIANDMSLIRGDSRAYALTDSPEDANEHLCPPTMYTDLYANNGCEVDPDREFTRTTTLERIFTIEILEYPEHTTTITHSNLVPGMYSILSTRVVYEASSTQPDATAASESNTEALVSLQTQPATQTSGVEPPTSLVLSLKATTPTASVDDPPVLVNPYLPWLTGKPPAKPLNLKPSSSTLAVRTSFLYGIYAILALSVVFIIGQVLYTLFKRCRSWYRSWFLKEKDDLPQVEVEESAGVSFTDGSSVSSSRPGAQEPGEWPGGWARTTATDRLDNSSSTGSELTTLLPTPVGTVRRARGTGTDQETLPHGLV